MKKGHSILFAIAAVIVMICSPLAAAGWGTDADAELIDTAPLPEPKQYMYDLWTDDNNVTIKSVKASTDGSELLEITGEKTSKGLISGFWGFDSDTGMGPFNSFYAAINISEGSGSDNGERQLNHKVGTIAFVLDPYELSTTLRGTALKGTYNIMLVIPTVYWKSDSNHLYLSSSPSYNAGGFRVSGMVAYAHSFDDDKTFTNEFPYIGIGVYEAAVIDDKLLSVGGSTPTAHKTCDEFKAYANNGIPADNSGYQLWNFYQWTLYKMMSYAVMGTKNSQEMMGDGPVHNSAASATGLADSAGPYAPSTSDYSKLFIENSWGSLFEFIGDTAFSEEVLYTGNTLGGKNLGEQTADSVSLPEYGWISVSSSESAYWDIPVSSQYYPNDGDLDAPGDYVWSSSDWRSLGVGGCWIDGSFAGVAYTFGNRSLGFSGLNFGARLAYVMADDAAADFVESDDMTFKISGGKAALIGYSGSAAELEVPDRVNGAPVTEIAGEVFNGCTSLESITIPDTAESVGDKVFYGCSSLKSVSIGKSVVSIGTSAFEGCSALESIVIPSSADKVGEYAFKDCYSLESAEVLGTATRINFGAFNNCASLEEFVYPDGATYTGDSVFSGCTSLSSVTLPSAATSIGGGLFSGCSSLESIVIPDSVVIINSNAFRNCISLESVTIPDSVKYIYGSAFGGCFSLTEVCIGKSADYIQDNAFDQCPIKTLTVAAESAGTAFAGIGTLESLELLATVSSVGDGAFAGCTDLSTIIIRNPGLTVGKDSFPAGFYDGDDPAESGDLSGEYYLDPLGRYNRALYTVTFVANDASFGSVSPAIIKNIRYGAEIEIDGDTISIGGVSASAVPSEGDGHYTYSFLSWDTGDTSVTGSMKITAEFGRTANRYTVTVVAQPDGYGSVTKTSITADYGTSVSVKGDTLTVGKTKSKAVPAQSTDQCVYSFESWSNVPKTVTGDVTVYANFESSAAQYTVTVLPSPEEYGSVTETSFTVGYGTPVSAEGDVLTVGKSVSTAVPAESDAQYTYSFVSWEGVSETVTENITIYAIFDRSVNQYTVTVVDQPDGYGSVTKSSVTADYGTSISANGDALTVGKTESKAVPSESDAQYTYSFVSWEGVPETVTGNVTIYANFERAVNQYEVKVVAQPDGYGSVTKTSITADYGTSVTVKGDTLTVGKTKSKAVPAQSTDQCVYSFASWSKVPKKITGDITVYANFESSAVQYTVTVLALPEEYGSVTVQSFSVDYGTPVSAEGDVLAVGKSVSTAVPAESDAQYTYSFVSWGGVPETVTGNVTIYANFERIVNRYTVSVIAQPEGYGSVTVSSFTVDYGTSMSIESNVLTVGDSVSTAVPADSDAQYTYSFESWTDVPESVTGDTAVYANFERTVNKYTVTIAVQPDGYGSVTKTSITADYGTSVSAKGDTLTVGKTKSKAVPADSDDMYDYSFVSWENIPKKVAGDVTVYANFERTVSQCEVKVVAQPDGYGSVTVSSFTVEYGTSASAEDDVLTVGDYISTAVPADSDAQYTYSFVSWEGVPETVTENVTIYAEFERIVNQYEVKVVAQPDGYGSVTVSSFIVDYGTSMSAEGDVLTVGKSVSTAVPADSDAQYSYSFESWTDVPDTVAGDVTIYANFERAVNRYTVIVVAQPSDYGSVTKTSITADYGTSVSAKGDTLTVGKSKSTAVPAQSTDQCVYSFAYWSNVPKKVTGDITVYANFESSAVQYTVTVLALPEEYGSVTVPSFSVEYGTSVSADGDVLTVGESVSTAVPADSDAQYTYSFVSWEGVPETVAGNVTIYANFERAVNQYTVSVIAQPEEYGSVTVSLFTVGYGTSVSVEDDVLTVGDSVSAAVPADSDAQYTYSFVSWEGVPESVTEDITVYAEFERTVNLYEVTVQVQPSGYGTVTVQRSSAFLRIVFPSLNDSPSDEGSPVTVSVPYGAKFEIDGDRLSVAGTTFTAVPAESDAQYTYSFDGWSGVPDSVTGEATIHAEFGRTVNMYTIVLIAGEGGLVNGKERTEMKCGYGDTVTAAAVPDRGYRFSEWSDSWNNASRTITVESDAEYTALFEEIILSVVWKDWDGTVLFSDSVKYGSEPVYGGPEPSRTGYDFVGWNPEVSEIYSDTVYTAVYGIIMVTYTWLDSDGTVLYTETIPYGEKPVYGGPVPVKEGYVFKGWDETEPNVLVAVFEKGLPVPFVDFRIKLGYDPLPFGSGVPENYRAHDEYWTLSVDFAGSIPDGYSWPYGDGAYLKVTFYFCKDGSSAWKDARDVPDIIAKTVNVPVYDVNGMPFVNDVLCTPDMWPDESGAGVYPVYAEAILLYRLNVCPDTAHNPCQTLGWDYDFAAFEYAVEYLDVSGGTPVTDGETGQPLPYSYGWADWGVVGDSGSIARGTVTVPAAHSHPDSGGNIVDGVPGNELLSPEFQSLDPVETPKDGPHVYMGFADADSALSEYFTGKGVYGADGTYSWPNWPDSGKRVKPNFTKEMADAYLSALNPVQEFDGTEYVGSYNEIVFLYRAETFSAPSGS